MVTNIESPKETLVAIRLTGTLDKHDYDRLKPVVEGKITQFGKIDFYWEMDNLEGWNLDGLWEELKFDVRHVNSFRKVAIVGDKKWEEWIAKMIKPFTSAEVHFFDAGHKQEAMAWVSQ